MTLQTPPSQDPNVDFLTTLKAFMTQTGYESDNTVKGVKSAIKDYVAVVKSEPPQWINDIWPSIALSVLHLAIAKSEKLPEDFKFPNTALKSEKTPLQDPEWTSPTGANGI